MSLAERGEQATKRLRAAVIAPSGPFDRVAFDAGIERLRSVAEVAVPADIGRRQGFLAGDDDSRLRELHAALEDDSCDILVAARGGYGATRILSRIDRDLVARARKPLVGFSDITALHASWHRAGVPSVHAANVTGLAKLSASDFAAWASAAKGNFVPLATLRALRPGDAEGPVVGGNLAVLAALAGTPCALDARDAIVLLEDVGERPYRIDRMLTTLLENGAFRGARGFVLGEFTRCDAGDDGISAESVLVERLGALGVPIYADAPVGHGDRNVPVPFGITAHLHQGALSFRDR